MRVFLGIENREVCRAGGCRDFGPKNVILEVAGISYLERSAFTNAQIYAALRADQIISAPNPKNMIPVSIRPRLACSGLRNRRTACLAPSA